MELLELFRDWADVEEFAEQSVIFTEGQPADVMYVILSGKVELTLHGEFLSQEGEGDIIGEMATVSSATRNCTATALSAVRLAKLDRERFKEIISSSSEFSLHMMAVLADRLRAVDKYISSQIKGN